jgi:hypothetical protein
VTQRLKRWESPRRQGRNDKGKGGSARQRQLKKQQQMLRKKLKEGQKADNQNQQGGRDTSSLPFLLLCYCLVVDSLRVSKHQNIQFWKIAI